MPRATGRADLSCSLGAARRRRTWTVRRYTDLNQMKADEYAYWQSQPAHVRLAAVSEITSELYAMKGIHVSRFQRTVVSIERL